MKVIWTLPPPTTKGDVGPSLLSNKAPLFSHDFALWGLN